MKHIFAHIRSCILRGLWAIIPLVLCYFALQLLYVLIDKRVMAFLGNFFNVRQIPGLGLLLVLVVLYLIGLVVSNIIGHQLFRFIEAVSQRIPFIKTIYSVGKQLSHGLGEEQQSFKKMVLVKLDHSEVLTPAFVMSTSINNKTGEEMLFVFVPTAPTPAGGFVCIVKTSQTIDPGWTPEEGLKVILSMGIIAPKEVNLHTLMKKAQSATRIG